MKVSFDKIVDTYYSMYELFELKNVKKDDPKFGEMEARFMSLFTLLLVCVGWTEDEFFRQLEGAPEEDGEEEEDDPDSVRELTDLMVINPANKPN